MSAPAGRPLPAPRGLLAAVLAVTALLAVVTATRSPSSGPSSVETMSVYVSGYTWFDNTPAGSAAISHPQVHQSAGGAGTYTDPTTVAVGHSLATGHDVLDFPAGTRFYIPTLRRYLVVEDTCGDGRTPQDGPCHTGYPAGTTAWLDVYLGGAGTTEAAATACAGEVTGKAVAIRDPRPDYPVTPGAIVSSSGCTPLHGNTIPG